MRGKTAVFRVAKHMKMAKAPPPLDTVQEGVNRRDGNWGPRGTIKAQCSPEIRLGCSQRLLEILKNTLFSAAAGNLSITLVLRTELN